MEGSFIIEYGTINKIVKDHYEKKYPGMIISCKTEAKKTYHPDGWGFYDECYEIESQIIITKQKKILGQVVNLQSSEVLNYRPIFEIVNGVLSNLLKLEGNDDIVISYLSIEERYAVANVKQKEKNNEDEKILKKVNG